MKKIVMYQYLGTNGAILSPVHLEDVYYIRKLKLLADKNKILVNGDRKVKSVTIPEDELKDWTEIEYMDGQE